MNTALFDLASGFIVGQIDDKNVIIERTVNVTEPARWAVRFGGTCLAKDGEWEWERLPSSRDDGFFGRCRWDKLDEAVGAAETAIRKAAADPEFPRRTVIYVKDEP